MLEGRARDLDEKGKRIMPKNPKLIDISMVISREKKEVGKRTFWAINGDGRYL